MIDITKNELKAVATDLADEIARQAVWKYTQEWVLTEEETDSMLEIITNVSLDRISDVIGGYCQ